MLAELQHLARRKPVPGLHHVLGIGPLGPCDTVGIDHHLVDVVGDEQRPELAKVVLRVAAGCERGRASPIRIPVAVDKDGEPVALVDVDRRRDPQVGVERRARGRLEVASHGVDRIGNVLVGLVIDGDLRPEREDRDQRGRAEPLPEMRVDMPGLPAPPERPSPDAAEGDAGPRRRHRPVQAISARRCAISR